MRKKLGLIGLVLTLAGCSSAKTLPEVSMAATQQETVATVTEESTEATIIIPTVTEIEITKTTENQQEQTTEEENSSEETGLYVILTLGREEAYYTTVNEKTLTEPQSGLREVTAIEWTADSIRELICSYEVPEKPYIDGEEMKESDKEELLASRNIEGITGQVRYGLLKENTSMRSFPSDRVVTGDLKVPTADFLQETGVYGCSPVAVLNESNDGQWCFVQCENYAGWIYKSSIVFTDRLMVDAYINTRDFGVVTDAYINLGRDIFRMGEFMPRVEDMLIIPSDESEADSALILSEGQLILTDKDAEAEIKLYTRRVAMTENTYDKFLECNPPELEMLMKRMEGISYSWGDKALSGFDCSSTLGAIYRCCGIRLPRNTSILKFTGAEVIELLGMSSEERINRIKNAPYGSLLVIPGHVVMLVDYPDRMFFHNSTHYQDDDGNDIVTRQAGFTDMFIKSGSGNYYYDIATFLIIFS